MSEVLTGDEMRAAETAAIDSGAVTGLELMERAGAGVVAALLEQWPELAREPGHALVLCGPGNNGGDGFVVARLLRGRGWNVAVFLLGDPGKLPPDARRNHDRWRAENAVAPLDEASLLRAAGAATAARIVIVDALFGTGQRGPLDAPLAPVNALIDALFEVETGPAPLFVAVDLPTGFDTDSGARLARRPLPADLIVTFHRAKPAHRTPELEDIPLAVADIGL